MKFITFYNSIRTKIGRRGNLAIFILLFAFSAYVLTWSYISIARYYALNAYVYDLGLSMERLWLVFHSTWTVTSVLEYFIFSGIVFVVSPIVFLNSFVALLVFQTVMLGIAVFPIYGISKHFLKRSDISVLLSCTYLIYFPLAGVNFFDFHFQALFIPLFLFSYYSYLKERYLVAALLFSLSAIVRYPFMIYTDMFGIFLIAGNARLRRKGEDKKADWYLSIFLVVYSSLLLTSGYLAFSASSIISTVHYSNVPFSSPNNINNDLFTFFIVLIPVLFVPLLSKKWAFFLLPYFILALTSDFPGYLYPFSTGGHYASSLIPFIYLGTVDSLYWISKVPLPKPLRFFKILSRPTRRSVTTILVVSIVVSTVFTGVLYDPYGPLNGSTTDNFLLHKNLDYNMTRFDDMAKLLNSLPEDENASQILIQDNIPMALPKPSTEYASVLTPVLYPFSSTLSVDSAISNRFPVNGPHGVMQYVSIQYAVADPYSFTFTSGNPSMEKFVNFMLESGKYGILAERDGMFVLARGYHGPINNYAPYNVYLAYDSNIDVSNTSQYGSYSFLPPGTFNVTFFLKTYNTSLTNSASLVIDSNYNTVQLAAINVTGNEFHKVGIWQSFSISIHTNQTYMGVTYAGIFYDWTGQTYFGAVSVEQIN